MGILVPGDAVSGTFLAGVRLRSHFPMVRDLPRLFAYHRISPYNVEIWNIRNIVTSPDQYGSAQKLATLAGGYYPPLHGVCH